MALPSKAVSEDTELLLWRVVCNPFRVGSRVGEVPVAAFDFLPGYFLPALQAEATRRQHDGPVVPVVPSHHDLAMSGNASGCRMD